MTDWIDRNKSEKLFAIIDSNKFNFKNKIGDSNILTLKTLLIILEIMQLVEYLLKKI